MKRILTLCLALGLALSLAGCCISADQITTYTASYIVYVSNRTASAPAISSGDLTTSQSLVETYKVLLLSNNILNPVAEKLDAGLSADRLREMMEITSVNDTEVMKISVTADDSQLALHIAQTHAELAPDTLAKIIEGSTLKIVDNPTVTENISIFNLLP